MKEKLQAALIASSDRAIKEYQQRIAKAQALMKTNKDFEFLGNYYQYPLGIMPLQFEIDDFKLINNKSAYAYEYKRCFNQLTPTILLLKFPLLTPADQRIEQQKNTRYSNFLAIKDPRFPSYNANVIGNFIVCEGPTEASRQRFAEQVVLNNAFSVNAILVLGAAREFQKGERQDKHYNYYSNVVTHKISQGIKRYDEPTFMINYDQGNHFAISIYNADQWGDFQANGVNELDKRIIFKLFQDTQANNQHIIIHCSAGLGRTGTLVLAYYLYKDFDNIFNTENDDIIAPRIIAKLNELRSHRPGLVQTLDQIIMATQLAHDFKKFSLEENFEDILTDKLNEYTEAQQRRAELSESCDSIPCITDRISLMMLGAFKKDKSTKEKKHVLSSSSDELLYRPDSPSKL